MLLDILKIKMKKLRTNFLYNSIFQILTLIVPLITTPYVARVLGASNLGIFAYTNANINYFTILASLGFNLYAQNEIAKVRDNQIALSRVFSSVLFTRIICSMIIFLLFIIFNVFVFKSYSILYWILSLQILGVAFDVSWLFMGLEEFKKISIRNLVVKIINTFLIFVLVRSKNDLLIYAGILMVGMVISNLIIWSDVKKYVLSFEMDTSAFSGIFFASLILFLPTSAITVYTDIIRTFLGIVTTKRYVAFYVQADMLIKVIFSLITSLGTVIMPHVSNLISKGKFIQVKKLISKSFFIMTLTSLPITVLVFALSDNFIRLFLGNNFLPTSQLLKINAISIIFSAWANVLGIQYLLPIGRVKDYTLSITLPALSIFVTAPIFFKLFGVAGVMYSIVLIQISVFIIELIYLRNELEICSLFASFPKMLINSILMYFSIIIFLNLTKIHSDFFSILMGGTVGIVLYMLGCFLIEKKRKKVEKVENIL